MGIIILQRLLLEAFIDIFYFPLWWYSRGIMYVSQKCLRILAIGNEELAPGLWLKNLFVPMFGHMIGKEELLVFHALGSSARSWVCSWGMVACVYRTFCVLVSISILGNLWCG